MPFGNHLQIRFRDRKRVGLLHQDAAGDAFQVRQDRFRRNAAHIHQSKIFLPRKRLACRGIIPRRDYAFDKKLGHFGRRFRVYDAIEGDHAAKSRYGIAHERLAICLGQRLLLRRSTRIVVLDNRAGRVGKLLSQRPSRIQIHQVVVRELFALNLLSPCYTRRRTPARNVQCASLVRILAIAQRSVAR